MNKSGRVRQLISSVVLLCSASVAHASDCGLLGNLLDVCKAAEVAGKEAGEKAAKAVVDASENVFKSVNYFGSLIEDFYSSDPAKKERASKILKGVFGEAFATSNMQWQVRLAFRGLDTTKSPLRVIILTDVTDPIDPVLTTDIHEARRVDWNPQTIRGNKPASPTDLAAYKKDMAAIQADIEVAISPVMAQLTQSTANFSTDLERVCLDKERKKRPRSGSSGVTFEQIRPCLQEEGTKRLAAVVLAVADDRVDLRADQLVATAPWLGQQFVTIVIPEGDLKAHPRLEMEMTIHDSSNVDIVAPAFQDNPREISAKRMLSSKSYMSLEPEHGGTYKAFTVALK